MSWWIRRSTEYTFVVDIAVRLFCLVNVGLCVLKVAWPLDYCPYGGENFQLFLKITLYIEQYIYSMIIKWNILEIYSVTKKVVSPRIITVIGLDKLNLLRSMTVIIRQIRCSEKQQNLIESRETNENLWNPGPRNQNPWNLSQLLQIITY